MTDFSAHHEGRWREGEMPQIANVTLVVSYDQQHHAYRIPHEEADAFVEWVAQEWEIDRAPREEDEEAEAYLDRIGVSIREWP